MPKKRRVNQSDVALLAGASRSAVSLVLNGRASEQRLSLDMVERIQRAINELGYQRHASATHLRTGRTMCIGMFAQLEWHVFSAIADAVIARANALGYRVLMQPMHLLDSDPRRGLGLISECQADALIAIGGHPLLACLPLWSQADPPPVCTTTGRISGRLPCATLDARPGLEAAIDHLQRLGHRHITWIGPTDEDEPPHQPRGRIVAMHCHKRGLASTRHFLPITSLTKTPQQLVSIVASALPEPLPSTALMCWNDACALALYEVLRQRGLRIPSDCAVVGFDDSPAARSAIPRLATISHNPAAIGENLMCLSDDIIAGRLPRSEAITTTRYAAAQWLPHESIGTRDANSCESVSNRASIILE